MKSYEMDLTAGNLAPKLLRFSIPLVLTNIMQVLFNMTDLAVVGRFSGPDALGAVGSVPNFLFIFTGLVIGLGSGVNSICAFFVGAKSKKDLSETIHTAFVICFVFGVILMAAGIVLARPVLVLMNTKPELIDGAVLYFKIYMIGIPFEALFNYGNGVLSAVGDTKRPLYFLTASGIANALLNLVFVIGLGMSVDGVAWGSVIANFLSAFLVLLALSKGTGDARLEFRKIRVNWQKALRVIKLGIPAGLQNMIFGFANMFMQMGLNSFDAVMVSGNAAAANADTLIYNIMAAFYVGCATFIGQNYGAGKKSRVVKSYVWGTVFSFAVGLALGILLLVFAREFLSLFTDSEKVIACGLERVRIMAFAYCVSAFMDNSIAACRGLGKTLVPSVMVSLGSCVFRIVWIFTVFAHFKTLPSLFLLFPCSWIITAVFVFAYFLVILKRAFPKTVQNL